MRFPYVRLVASTAVAACLLTACSIHQEVGRDVPTGRAAASAPTAGSSFAAPTASASASVAFVGCAGLAAATCPEAWAQADRCTPARRWWSPPGPPARGRVVATAPSTMAVESPAVNVCSPVVNVGSAPVQKEPASSPVPGGGSSTPVTTQAPPVDKVGVTKIEFTIEKLLDASLETPSFGLAWLVVLTLVAYIAAHLVLTFRKEDHRRKEEEARRKAGLASAGSWKSPRSLAIVGATIVAVVWLVSRPAVIAAPYDPPPGITPVRSGDPVETQLAMLRAEVASLVASLRAPAASASCCSPSRKDGDDPGCVAILLAGLLGLGGLAVGLAAGSWLPHLSQAGGWRGLARQEARPADLEARISASPDFPFDALYDVEDTLIPLVHAVARGAQAATSAADTRVIAIDGFLDAARSLRGQLEAGIAVSASSKARRRPRHVLDIDGLSSDERGTVNHKLGVLQKLMLARSSEEYTKWRIDVIAALAEARRELLMHGKSRTGTAPPEGGK